MVDSGKASPFGRGAQRPRWAERAIFCMALSVSFADSSPRGRASGGFGKNGKRYEFAGKTGNVQAGTAGTPEWLFRSEKNFYFPDKPEIVTLCYFHTLYSQ